MSRRNQDLVSRVKFEVDSRMASASMKALQKESADLNERINEVNASIKALGNVPDDNPTLQAYRKQLRGLESDLKDVNTTMKDYTRGVKAAGELYRHYAMGNIEDMSIKAIRAGVNGMKKRYDNLKAGGDPGDAEEMRLIEAIMTESDVVVKRLKTDYQHVVEEIARGGTVTEQTLKRTRDGLADLMQTAETEAEKNELTNYWQKVGAAIEAVAVENRRLRGEVADREEAMRIAYATDHEGSQQAIHDAEARADAARRENDELRQRLDLKQQQRRELGDKMENNSIQQQALTDRRDELKAQEKEDRAIRKQRVDDANKELNNARRAAKTQQQAYDEQKQTVEKLRTEVQGLTDDIRKMGEVKAEPKIDTSQIDELKQKIESLKQQKQGTSAHILDLEKEIEGLHEFDRIIDEGKKNIHIYWETIKEFEQKAASVKGKPAYMMGDIFDSSKADTDAMRNQVRTWIGELGKELKDNPQAKSITKLRDAYLQRVEDMMHMRDAANKRMAEGGFAADVEAELKQRVAAINRIIKEYREAFEKFEHSRAHYQDRMEGMGYEDSLRIKGEQLENNKKHLAQIDGELTDAQTKLATAQQQSTTAQQQSAQSSEQLAQKQEQLSQKTAELNQQQDKLNGMVDETVTANQRLARAEQEQTDARNAQAEAKKHEGEAVKKVEDELRGLTDEQLKNAQAYSHLTEEINTDTAAMQRNITTEQEATREADRLRSGSIDKMEQALARLRESNRKLDPTIDKEEWERGERAIGQLNLRLEELKKQSAELRREPVLDMMTQRMDQLDTLSRDALTETKKFWQAMYDGADKNDPELKKIEERLRNIATEEERRTKEALMTSAGRLGRNDLGTLSANELRQSIEDAKRLQATYKETSKEAQALAQMIVKAEEYQKSHGVEAVRQVRREQEAIRQREQQEQELAVKMRQRLMERRRLSADALAEVKKYWLAQKNGAEEGTLAFRRAEAALKMLDNVEQERNAARQQQLADRLKGRLSTFSTAEIKESIEAAKQLAVSYKSGSHEATELTNKIIAAEEHLNKYSIETARKTKKEADELKAMQQTFADAQKGSYTGASMEQLDEAIKRLKAYQATIKFPNAGGKTLFDGVGEQIEFLTAQLDALKGKTDKAKAAFADADEVMQRFSEHMKGTVVTAPGQSIDEQLSQHVSMYDDYIKDAAESTDFWEQQVKEATAELDKMEKELAELEKKHANSSWFRKQTSEYKREGWRIEDLKKDISGETFADGTVWGGQKEQVKHATEMRDSYQRDLDYYKQQKAEALGLVEVEEQVQKARRMTREEMQEGIKVLEAEAMAQDRSTADGQKRWEELRKTIGEMNQELKEATGEWMKLADAQKIAEGAGKKGFAASAQEIQQATQALERRREELIKQIRAERDLGNAVDAQEKELDDLTKKLRSLKFEQDNVNMSQEKMRTLIETPANAVNLDELRAAIKRADGQLRQMEQSLGQNSDEYKRFAEQVRQAKNVMKEMEGQAKASATAWEKAFNRLKTYVVMYMGFNEVWQKVSNTARDLMDLSDRMGEVRKTTGFTADEVGRLSENLKGLDSRRSLTELMELSSMAGSIGLKTVQDVQGFTEAANQLTVALPEMGAEASRTLMKIADATGDLEKNGGNVRETLERVGSTIIALRANSAAAAGPITDFVSRVGAVGAQAGISIDQIAALGATVDALGGRVEMSATALSRMIPAIRNNSFEVAKAIGMTEKELKDMTAMEQMVAIFRALRESVQGFDTSTEEGMNAMADKVEQMLGNSASMQEVMKVLNQQGARAGIVFGLLSQNVDMLEKQLGIADDAYRENIALMNEYLNMNETTAAKWERLKNQIEELFVSDTMQRGLGWLIDMLRGLVDFLTGNVSGAMKGLSVTVHTLAFAFLAFKSNIGGLLTSLSRTGKVLGDMKAYMQLAIGEMKEYRKQTLLLAAAHTAEEKAAIKAKLATLGAAKAMRANLFMAAAAAIAAIALQLYNVWKEARKVQDIASEAMANYSRELEQATKKADKMFESVGNARVAVKDANAEVKRAEDGLKAAKKALDEGRGSTESLEKAETDLKVAHQKVTAANNDHASSIRQLNQEYSPYLGYMLSEISTAAELANARELINAKLRETILLKQQEAAYGRVESEFGEKRDKRQKSVYDLVAENVTDPEVAARMRKDIMELVKQAKDGSKTIIDVRNEWAKISRDSGVNFSVTDFQAMESNIWRLVETEREIQDAKKIIDDNIAADIKVARTGTRDKKGNIVTKGTQQELEDQLNAIYKGDDDMENGLLQLEAKYKAADDKTRKKRAADLLQQMDAYEKLLANSKNFYDLQDEKETESYKNLLTNSDKRMQGLREQRDALLKAAGDAYKPIQETDNKRGNGGGGGGTNPYGQYDRVTDPYSKWNGDDLVARRKEMLVRVRALANGADVQKVLSEDAKFISEAVRKNIKTTDQAIEWYNAERLKIQEALYNKHLTPTGDWLDPKKGAGNWRKQLQTDFDNYLRILDAYYTERKAHIEKAQAEEGLSEAEAQRLTVENETVWRKHRMELQQIYLGKSADIAEDERQRIYNILAEQDEDSADMVEKQIAISINKLHLLAQKSEVEARKIETKLVKDIATDHYKQQNAVSKQMEAIEKIISEERPFDGITKNLRDNLSTMGVLFADFDKKRREAIERGEQPEDDMAERAKQMAKRLSVVLDGVPDAYRMTFDQLKEVMIKEGFGEWAKAIEGDEQLKLAMMAQIRKTYDQVQEAIRKEAALIKKHADNLWNDALTPDGKSMKNQFEAAISQLGLQADQVKRANSLIGAGVASDRVADRLVIQQMKVQLAMERTRFALMHKIGEERIRQELAVEESLRRQGKLEEAKRKHADIENMQKSLGLAISEEQKKVDEQRVAIQNQLEESQNRLYTSLREWADLLTSSVQGVMEAYQAGDAEYYNERAKLDLTGKGGPGAGTYVVIDDAGTSDAKAHYEYLDERQALERQHEIEMQNAQAEAWRKLMDDLNMKMSEQITDWMNAYLQNKATEDNTAELQRLQQKLEAEQQKMDASVTAMDANTQAVQGLTQQLAEGITIKQDGTQSGATGGSDFAADKHAGYPSAPQEAPSNVDFASDKKAGYPGAQTDPANTAATDANTQAVQGLTQVIAQQGGFGADKAAGYPSGDMPSVDGGSFDTTDFGASKQAGYPSGGGELSPAAQQQINEQNAVTENFISNKQKEVTTETQTGKKIASTNASTFAKMTQAVNLYGIAYQAMSNDNLSTEQKFQMIALQAAGQAAIAGLTATASASTATVAAQEGAVASRTFLELGPIAGPIALAALTAIIGGLMGMAVSKIAKGKSEIAQATGASVSAGRLATGMLTYKKGNVNELTDPASLTPGRQYNVDGADGKTYRARYMGKGAKTHITNGPEFHLVGEAGREAIIDAKTTRLLQMNETGIWRDIQTLYNGGSISGLSPRRRRGTGVRAFADGNVGEFEDALGGEAPSTGAGGMSIEMLASLQASIDRQSDLLENALVNGIKAVNKWTGSDGIPAMYNKLQKEAQRHGEKYL